jgi:uncharacterized protein YfdQ (DUF2303 family)
MIKEAIAYIEKQARKPYTVVESNGTIVTLDYEGNSFENRIKARHEGGPIRATGMRQLHNLDDLANLAAELGTSPRAYFDANNENVTVVLDDDVSGVNHWRSNRAEFIFQRSSEMGHIVNALNTYNYQSDFIEYVERILPFIVSPEPAIMLEVASSLQAVRNSKVENAVRTSDGNIRMQWIEETNGTAGATGDLEVPQKVSVQVPFFRGTDPVIVPLQFRYKLHRGDSAVSMGFFMPTLDVLRQRAMLEVIEGWDAPFPVVYGGAPTQADLI